MKRTRKQGTEEEEQHKADDVTKEETSEAKEEEGGTPKRSRTESSEKQDGGGIVVVNETDFGLNGWECPLLLKQGNSSSYHFANIPPHSEVDLTQHEGRTLLLKRKGLVFKDLPIPDSADDQGCPQAVLSRGSKYHIVEDEAGKPLTDDEVKQACRLVSDYLEHGGRVPQPFRSKTDELWEWVASQLPGRETLADSLKDMVGEQTTKCGFRDWSKLYYAKRPSLPAGSAELQDALTKREVGIVVYFRALDRFPGGNADMAVIKFKLEPYLACDNDKGKRSVKWMVWRNWDGQDAVSRDLVEREQVDVEKVEKKLLEPLKSLVSCATERSIETTIHDPAADDEEYDTEWSSIEILLYAPPSTDAFSGDAATEAFTSLDPENPKKEQWPLAFRMHQRSVSDGDGEDKEEEEDEEDEEDEEGEEEREGKEGRRGKEKKDALRMAADDVVEGASALFKMGRVESTLNDMKGPKTVSISDTYSIYITPIFLHED